MNRRILMWLRRCWRIFYMLDYADEGPQMRFGLPSDPNAVWLNGIEVDGKQYYRSIKKRMKPRWLNGRNRDRDQSSISHRTWKLLRTISARTLKDPNSKIMSGSAVSIVNGKEDSIAISLRQHGAWVFIDFRWSRPWKATQPICSTCPNVQSRPSIRNPMSCLARIEEAGGLDKTELLR